MALPARRPNLLLVLACVVLAVQVVVLALQNRELKAALAAEIEEDSGSSEAPVPIERARFAVGDFLEPFDVAGADGALRSLAFDGEYEHYLVFVYARGCSVCPMVVPEWRALAGDARPSVSVMGLQLEPLEPEAARDPLWRDLPFETYNLRDPLQVPFEKLTAVPLTLLVDAAGMVVWARYGVPDEAEWAELRSLVAAEPGPG